MNKSILNEITKMTYPILRMCQPISRKRARRCSSILLNLFSIILIVLTYFYYHSIASPTKFHCREDCARGMRNAHPYMGRMTKRCTDSFCPCRYEPGATIGGLTVLAWPDDDILNVTARPLEKGTERPIPAERHARSSRQSEPQR